MIQLTSSAFTFISGLALLAVAGCAAESDDATRHSQYQAEVIRTEYGVAHITADSYGGLGYGEAYAAAEDHVCNMALALAQSRGESALALGLDATSANAARDIVVKALNIPGRASTALAGQNPDIREWLRGYAAGYNDFLAANPDGVGSWCDTADWVRAASAEEFMAQYLMLLQTLPRAAQAITAAAPPQPQAQAEAQAQAQAKMSAQSAPLATTLNALELRGMGSNAWALGGQRTENQRGALLANPHYPWYGIQRFWEKHLTIPGEYEAYGVGLIGLPGVTIGFNEAVGWTHTVSNSKRTVMYQLQLNPDNPTQYRWNDDWRDLRSTTVSIDVASGDGIETISHTVWFSHHGPLMALPGLARTPLTVFAIRDANSENTSALIQWQSMAKANDMDAFIEAHRQYNAMPWVNTIAASADGRAVYIDNSTVGALSDTTIAAWQKQLAAVPQLQQLFLTRGLVILDGSNDSTEWLDTQAPITNTVPFEQRPLIESDHYVFNANDSYWLSDPDNPVTGFSPLYGPTAAPRSLRTRMNIELLRPDSTYNYAGEDGRFNMEEIQSALFGNDSLSAKLLLPQLLDACRASPKRLINEQTIDIAASCDVLAAWDGKFDIESRGAVLFREWITRYPATETTLGNTLFAQPFDPANPVATPNGLANPQTALDNLAAAQQLLSDHDIALDVPLGELQTGHRMNEKWPLHGGNRHEGIANLQMSSGPKTNTTEIPVFTGSNRFIEDSSSLSESGYNVVHGSSFIMALNFTDDGPKARAILSYSQSGDPESPHFSDQTQLYKDERWRSIHFKAADIAQHTISKRILRSN
jgi:acyl-homoserine-lactone acylase